MQSNSTIRSFWHIRVLALVVFAFVVNVKLLAAQESLTKEQLDFFENKIRPMLVAHCYECHSVEASNAGKLKGELMLDSREGLLKGGETGVVLIPGKPADSLLISALHYDELEMPPKGRLPEAIIADFEKWIEMGAPDPREGPAIAIGRKLDFEKGRQFWSFLPLKPDPKVFLDDPNIHPVDFFVCNKQKELGLQLSPMATPRILVRRAWFDLLGIPPTPEEMQSWTQRLKEDATASEPINMRAWSELIDHLLSRSEYGERWARHWMDIARFAESYGYEQDYDRPNAYHYRDFLIKAFNSDLPYDRFVQWQIAGDQLEPENPLAWMATGFLGAGAFPTQLTETEFEKTRYDELDDMVSTTGVAFLGLSIGCARCHDHKFDPLASEDYYRLAATFSHTIRAEKTFDLNPVENERRKLDFEAKLKLAQDELAKYASAELPREFKAWMKAEQPIGKTAAWQVMTGQLSSSAKTEFQLLADGSYLSGGMAPNQEVLTFESGLAPGLVKSVRVEALSDPSLPNKGPGRAPNGNFALCNLAVELIDSDGKSNPVRLKAPRATFQQNNDSLSVAAAIDADPVSGWAVDGQIGKDQAAVFDFDPSFKLESSQHLRIVLSFNHPNPQHAIGRLRLSLTSLPDAVPVVGDSGPPRDVVDAITRLAAASASEIQEAERDNAAEWKIALDWFKSQSPTWLDLSSRVVAIQKEGSGVQLTKVMVSSDGLPHLPHHADDRGYPHFYAETHLLRRGDVHQKVLLVTPGFPRVLRKESLPTDELQTNSTETSQDVDSRAALAKWMTDVDSGAGHLALRVIVNRLWQHHFGRGIVATPNDFGEMGERPTNPELLDWLGQQLLKDGWRLKPLHKAIMTSRTYMQAGKSETDSRSKIDPENTYFWHRAPQRLEAEAIRDSMLFVSGQLDSTMYGPGSLDSNMKRRSIYFFIKRSQLIPCMMLFDWPEHLVSIGQRQATTVAPQALMFMNSQQGRSYAESFATRVMKADDKASVESAYSFAFGRIPSANETKAAIDFLNQARQLRKANGETDLEKQALADLCQMLMSMNEFIYID